MELLLSELRGGDGKVRYRRPDPESEAAVAFSKIYAVYGTFENGVEMNFFQKRKSINDMLGSKKTLTDSRVSVFLFPLY